jgi:prophage antirepressor-like protein
MTAPTDATTLVPFMFGDNQQPVRVAIGPDEETWFALTDVCAILQIRQPASVTRRLDPDEYAKAHVPTPTRGMTEVTVISEAGLYETILRSNLPEAKQLRRFVAHEVLPAIRKHGFYITEQQNELTQRALSVQLDKITRWMDEIQDAVQTKEYGRLGNLVDRSHNTVGSSLIEQLRAVVPARQRELAQADPVAVEFEQIDNDIDFNQPPPPGYPPAPVL